MAVKTILKVARGQAVVKVWGTAGSVTIPLTDLKGLTEDVASPEATILAATFVGAATSKIEIARGTSNILTWGDNSCELDFGSDYVDNIEADKDIVVTLSGAECQLYLTLRKTKGFTSWIEPSIYGSHDDETKVG